MTEVGAEIFPDRKEWRARQQLLIAIVSQLAHFRAINNIISRYTVTLAYILCVSVFDQKQTMIIFPCYLAQNTSIL